MITAASLFTFVGVVAASVLAAVVAVFIICGVTFGSEVGERLMGFAWLIGLLAGGSMFWLLWWVVL